MIPLAEATRLLRRGGDIGQVVCGNVVAGTIVFNLACDAEQLAAALVRELTKPARRRTTASRNPQRLLPLRHVPSL